MEVSLPAARKFDARCFHIMKEGFRMEDVVVIGIVMGITEIVKAALGKVMTEDSVKRVVPLVVLVLAGGLNALASFYFAPDVPIAQAIGQGLTLGAIAGGVYGLGKAALGKS